MAATIIVLIFINSFFLFFSFWFEAARPWINIDYAFALILLTFGRRWIGAIILGLLLVVDVLAITAQIFPFPRLGDLIYLLKFSFFASWFHLLLLIVVAVLMVIKLLTFLVLSKSSTQKAALIAFNSLLAVHILFIYMNDGGESSRTTYRKADSQIVSSQSINVIRMRSHRFLDLFENEQPKLEARAAGATEPWFLAISDNQAQRRLLLIVIESWGDPVNEEIQKYLLSPLEKIPTTLFEVGNIKASGLTLDGELRELCMLRTGSFNLKKIQHGFESCLGNKLKLLGYTTGAMHGATGMMYDRSHWYPRAGFEETIFFENKLWPRRCFSFPGACDLDMLEEVESFFDAPDPRFFYWLTLNSHARYDVRDIEKTLFNCDAFDIPTDSESCRNLLLHAQFFNGLAHTLRQEKMQGVEVILVSDHTPVLMSAEEKRQNFVESSLPWVRLRIPAASAL
ncbi:sulfatase-like hydrolase/transferase [Halopseudomonas laoshanensis]|uniref:sulfatase-like hydrolase/transferase n=1 Tax=Halopseudomonas laoshanensis TaxID=2268758 RepID=UPI003736ED92